MIDQINIAFQRSVIRNLLEEEYDQIQDGYHPDEDIPRWTVQGLGMLRRYLTRDKTWRLHVWDPAIVDSYEGLPSQMHTHPWGFDSLVISGSVGNELFRYTHAGDSTHWRQPIFCGEGGGLEGHAAKVSLASDPPVLYFVGGSYSMSPHDIHISHPSPGSVTAVRRRLRLGADLDHADVFWRIGESFVSAEPRPATAWEALRGIELALVRW